MKGFEEREVKLSWCEDQFVLAKWEELGKKKTELLDVDLSEKVLEVMEEIGISREPDWVMMERRKEVDDVVEDHERNVKVSFNGKDGSYNEVLFKEDRGKLVLEQLGIGR